MKPNKGTEKQVLSKAASLDENTLGYGSKKCSDEETNNAKNLTNKNVEKKNSANITKSANALCDDNLTSVAPSGFEMKSKSVAPTSQSESKMYSSNVFNSSSKGTISSQPLVNGAAGSHASKPTRGKDAASTNKVPVGSKVESKATQEPKELEPKLSQETMPTAKPEQPLPVISVSNQPSASAPKPKKAASIIKQKSEEEKSFRPDEAEGPYVLVQSKKKREKKKQQRESG